MAGSTPFHDLADYMAIPRVQAITLAPDGSWLAATIATLSPDKKKFQNAIWRIDTAGAPARRLTRSSDGESAPQFLPDGSLLFISKRPDPDAEKSDHNEAKPALWQLPPDGGEAALIAKRPGGIVAVATARAAQQAAFTANVLPGEADEELRKQRKDAGVTAILHESAPVRYWDHDLGPEQLRLYAVVPGAQPRDLTLEPGRALDEQAFALSPDGRTLYTGWWHRDPAGDSYVELVSIDVATGERRTLLSDTGQAYGDPAVSPDGRYLAFTRLTYATADEPVNITLFLLDLAHPEAGPKDLFSAVDRWPAEFAWSPDSTTIYVTADDDGRRPVFAIDVAAGKITKLTSAAAAYLNPCPSPDGSYLYALKSGFDLAPSPVRIDLRTGEELLLDCPGTNLPLPGRLEELEITVDDGQRVRSWIVLPEGADRSALVLWVHGGPHASFNAWSWRWCPWLMAARGYAVLLPDPALSTGYGQHMLRRGHFDWGKRAYEDVMAVTDAAEKRPDIDETRTAMMGGSYGGYMANWIAGHTDRFKAIVSHASLWALDQMFTTTDEPAYWWGQFGDALSRPEVYLNNSPHLHVGSIRTPMLIIHGDKDYRVPIGEALRLWGELTRHGIPAKFLYYPDENHWILNPGNAKVWYETIFAFLGEHVLGDEWQRPKLL